MVENNLTEQFPMIKLEKALSSRCCEANNVVKREITSPHLPGPADLESAQLDTAPAFNTD